MLGLMDIYTPADGVPNTNEISAGVSQVTLNNPVDVGLNTEKSLAIREITKSFMQCEQNARMIRMQGVKHNDLIFLYFISFLEFLNFLA